VAARVVPVADGGKVEVRRSRTSPRTNAPFANHEADPILDRDSLRTQILTAGKWQPRRLGTTQQETMRVVVAGWGALAYGLRRFSNPKPTHWARFSTRVRQKRDGRWRLLATAPALRSGRAAAAGSYRVRHTAEGDG